MSFVHATLADGGGVLQAGGFTLPVPPSTAPSPREGRHQGRRRHPAGARAGRGDAVPRRDRAAGADGRDRETLGDELVVHGRLGEDSLVFKRDAHRAPSSARKWRRRWSSARCTSSTPRRSDASPSEGPAARTGGRHDTHPLVAHAGRVARAGAAGSARAAELVVWHAYRAEEKAAFEKVGKAYEASKPGTTVTLLAVPYDAFADKITAAVPRGKGPDVFIFGAGPARAAGSRRATPSSPSTSTWTSPPRPGSSRRRWRR